MYRTFSMIYFTNKKICLVISYSICAYIISRFFVVVVVFSLRLLSLLSFIFTPYFFQRYNSLLLFLFCESYGIAIEFKKITAHLI